MKNLFKVCQLTALAAMLALAPVQWSNLQTPQAQAQNNTTPNIVIPLGHALTIDVPGGISTFVLGNSEIANVVVPEGQIRSRYAIVTALKPGVTNMLIWTEKGRQPINYVVQVAENFRDEQVAVRVKVLEIDKTTDGKVGVDWSDSISFREAAPNMPFRLGLPLRTTTLDAKIDTLINDRKARLLAEPTLVLLNGKEGSFLSGGEVPLLAASQNGINVQWKQYGVTLKMKALLEGAQTIQLELTPEVSDTDRANSVTLANQGQGGSFIIPAFKTRRAQTTLRVQNNQTIVIAGLLQNTQQEVEQKFPLLGDIPILGYLFKTIDFQEKQSELVFVVTPTIVRDPMIKPESGYAKDANVKNK